MSHSTARHIPILLDPITHFLKEGAQALLPNSPSGIILDCTFGGGGHTARLLECVQTTTHCVLSLDRDPEAIERGKIRFADEIATGKLELVQRPFSQALEAVGERPIYGLLADLGISSDQIDSETRGFSFRFPAPLDMRMNPTTGRSLSEWLHVAGETEIADVIWKYGEERLSRKIAKRLVFLRDHHELPDDARSLADTIAKVFPPHLRFNRTHPATQTFQAFRIFLNQELEELEILIQRILPKVYSGGRIAILSFHSLEDRMVKEALRNVELYSLPQRKAIQPTEEEILTNPRSRSAKLRLAVKK